MLHDRNQYRRAEEVVKALERRIKRGITGDRDRARAAAGAEELVAYEWAERNPEPASEHLRLELAASNHRGEPLGPGDPVPGCGCEDCIGGGDVVTLGFRYQRKDDLPVERARSVPITEVARRLGIEVNRHGWALCFAHADTDPSLHVNAKKNAAFCNPCGASWDGIGLVMELEDMEFHEAVKEIAGWTGWTEAA